MTQTVVAYDRSPETLHEWRKDEKVLVELVRESRYLKIGLESMSCEPYDPSNGGRNPDISAAVMARRLAYSRGDCGVVWDAKLNDIPNTIARTIRNLARKVDGITIHASVGWRGLEAAARAREQGRPSGGDPKREPILFGVTVLTSFSIADEASLADTAYVFGTTDIEAKVIDFAKMLVGSGIGGVVCSPRELRALREKGLAEKLVTFVPGGRPAWAEQNDQARSATPTEIARLGADYAVFGRPVWEGPYTPEVAVHLIKEEMDAA